MHRAALLVAFVIGLIFELVPVANGAEHVRGYIYDGVGRAKKTSIVINVTTHDVEIMDKADARVGASLSGVAKNYDDCGDNKFYCLTGMLEIVIPKVMPLKQWKYHGLSCESVAQLGGDAYRITCRSPKYRGRPTYTYSLSRGVLSIESSPVAGDYRYELRGEQGLLSSGNNPREVPRSLKRLTGSESLAETVWSG